jgi:hypothetical protein
MSTEANTPAEELAPVTEQATVRAIEEGAVELEPIAEEPVAPAAPAKPADEKPVDPRAARMEELAERNRAHSADELEQARETFTQAEPVVAPERMIKLKVRGEVVELPESEVIARAQKNDAADQYLTEARDLLAEAKRTVKQPSAVQTPEPAPAPAEPKADPIAKAVEMIQVGGDPAEVRAILASEIAEQAKQATEQALTSRDSSTRARNYDADYDGGFAEVANAADTANIMKDAVGFSTVRGLTGSLQAYAIADFLGKAPEHVQSAFAGAGITAETLPRYTPEDANALYRDMLLKGYHLPRPSDVIKAAAKTVAERFTGNTPPAPAPVPAPTVLDRSARKDALVQPERTALPRASTAKPAPRSEAQRAASARQELRGARRSGAARG